MTTTDYEMPKDVVPPGAQTGIYYIPISSVCETPWDWRGGHVVELKAWAIY